MRSNQIVVALSSALFTIASVVFVIIFVLQPAFLDIVRLKEQQKVYENILSQLEKKLQIIQQQSDYLASHQEEFAKLAFYFPYDYDYSFFLYNLHKIVEAFGGKLISATLVDNPQGAEVLYKTSPQMIYPLSFSIIIEAKYEQFLKILSALEDLPYLVQITSFGYSTKVIKNQKKERFNFTLILFRLKYPLVKYNILENAGFSAK